MTASANEPDLPEEDMISGDKIEHREEIHGDKILQDKVLGDKITQYIFQGLADAAARYKQFTELEKQPYLPDRPFAPIERPLFTGREEEIRDILRYLGDEQRQTVVIYGAADVGKTSLISAGIIPGLSIVGAIPLLLQDYRDPAADLKRELLTQGAMAGIVLKEEDPANMAQDLVQRSGQGLVLILDQFERVFMPATSEEKRQELRRTLGQMIAAVRPRYLRLLIAVREDMSFQLDPPWRDLLPDLGQSVIYLEGLEIDEARKAIELPVKLVREDPQLFAPFYYDREGEVINELILPELDELSRQEQRLILPADLQIVCFRLYEAAQQQDIPIIDHKLYWQVSKDKGAAYIIDNHFRRLIMSLPAGFQKQAKIVSQAMLEDVQNFWSTPEGLAVEGGEPGEVALPPDQIKATMDEMVRAGILISHESEGQWTYAFASNSIANAAGRAAGPEYQKKLEARKQVNAIWSAWVYYDALASPGQLRLIERYSQEKDPLNVLLYLRSAVFHDMPVDPWLERLDTPEARRLLQEMDEIPSNRKEKEKDDPDFHRTADLLGLLDEHLSERMENVGPLTWSAAKHPNSTVRRTAVLALMAATENDEERRSALDKVDNLWEEDWIDRSRMAELIGTLSNASDEIAQKNKKRPLADRFAIWRWRFGRLYNDNKRYLWTLTLGGGLGVGLGLGFLRAILALFMPYRSGDALFFYTPNGFFLGAALTFGVLLAPMLRLTRPHIGGEDEHKRPLLLALVMGGLFFALMHLVMGLILSVGLIRAPLAHLAAFVAGGALAWVIYDQPQGSWREQIGRFIARSAVVGLIFALIQTFFILFDPQSFSLQFAWNGFFYRQQLQETFEQMGFTSLLSNADWFHYFAVLDAALSGFFMAIGLLIGFLSAARGHASWLALKIRAGE